MFVIGLSTPETLNVIACIVLFSLYETNCVIVQVPPLLKL